MLVILEGRAPNVCMCIVTRKCPDRPDSCFVSNIVYSAGFQLQLQPNGAARVQMATNVPTTVSSARLEFACVTLTNRFNLLLASVLVSHVLNTNFDQRYLFVCVCGGVCVCVWGGGGERERERERQRQRQRQRKRQTESVRQIETDRETDRQTEKQRDRQTETSERDRQRDRQTDRETKRQTDRDTQRDRERETER